MIYKGFQDAGIEGWLAIPAGAGPHPGLADQRDS